MSRYRVNLNRSESCSYGLHVASCYYAQAFTGDTLIEVSVNPDNVVAVPTDCNQQKMRVCEYTVLNIVKDSTPYTESFLTEDSIINKSMDNKSDKSKTIISSPVINTISTFKGDLKTDSNNSSNIINISDLSAKQIIDLVFDKTNIFLTISLKNKQSIIKKAKQILIDNKYTVI